MPRIPMTREAMLSLKDTTAEKNRLRKIQRIVHDIYDEAVYIAKHSNIQTSYNFELPSSSITFYRENRKEILEGLQALFPTCSVSHTMLSPGKRDGKLYDIGRLTDAQVNLVADYTLPNTYLVIDWS